MRAPKGRPYRYGRNEYTDMRSRTFRHPMPRGERSSRHAISNSDNTKRLWQATRANLSVFVRRRPGSAPAGFLSLLAGAAAADPAALLRVEDRLAEPDRGRGHLDALVLGAELKRLLQAEDPRRDQPLKFLTGGLADVGDLLLLGDVHVHVVAARVLADDHALVDLGARRDEQRAALLEVEHGVAGRRAGPVGDQRAGRPAPDDAGPRLVALEDVVRDPRAPCLGE